MVLVIDSYNLKIRAACIDDDRCLIDFFTKDQDRRVRNFNHELSFDSMNPSKNSRDE